MSRAASSVSAHLALGAACVVGCWTGAALDLLHDGGLLWRSLCLVPGWPTPQQLALRLQLMPLSATLTLLLPTLVWALPPGPRRLTPLAVCLAAAVLALAPAIYVCRLSGQLGWPLNQTLAGMLLLEAALMLGIHASLSPIPSIVRALASGWRPQGVRPLPLHRSAFGAVSITTSRRRTHENRRQAVVASAAVDRLSGLGPIPGFREGRRR